MPVHKTKRQVIIKKNGIIGVFTIMGCDRYTDRYKISVSVTVKLLIYLLTCNGKDILYSLQ